MIPVGIKELTLTKIGGNSSMNTPNVIALEGLDEIDALKASSKRARKLNKKFAEEAAAQKINDSAKSLQLAIRQANNLSPKTMTTDISEQIILASENLKREVAKKESLKGENFTSESSKATDLATIIDLSGGAINALVVWRIDGDVDFYLPWNRKIITNNDVDVTEETAPRHSMRDFDLPAADLQLIAGEPKIISINGTRYNLANDPAPSPFKKGEKLSLDDLSNPQILAAPAFLKVGGNSEFTTPDSKTLLFKGEQGEKAALEFAAKRARELNRKIALGESPKLTKGKRQETTSLEGIIELSGGAINALVVWRIDGDVDFYLPENRKVVANNEVSEDTPPKWAMRDFDLPAADLQLIAGEPKIISINGTRYILGNNP